MALILGLAFLQTLLLSLMATPLTKKLAALVGAVDVPNDRKVHSQPTPRLGGLAICGTLFFTLAMYYFLFPQLFHYIFSDSTTSLMTPDQGILLAGAMLMVFILGVWDDIKTLEPAPKFLVQFIAASMIYFAGFEIDLVAGLESSGIFNLDLLISYPLTVVWIVGITNAINLIDGLDGLASGVAIISLSTMATISFIYGQIGIGVTCLLLGGSIMGFLWYNFRPATIFLGDSGSLFLGFALALLSIASYTKTSTAFAVLIPVFVLGLPIIDTLLSMIRRFFSWFLPSSDKNAEDFSTTTILKSMFRADKSHIHHQLINRGLSHRNTVLVLYVVSLLFGLGALLVSMTEQFDTTIGILLLLAVAIKMGVRQLRYNEIDLFRNGIFLTFYNAVIINKRHGLKLLDSLFTLFAFAGAHYLLYPDIVGPMADNQYDVATIMGTIFVGQTCLLWLSGLYKESIRHLGIADIINSIKAVALAVTFTGLLHYFFLQAIIDFSFAAYILDFYFLGTLILGMRLSFHLLKYLFHRSRANKRRVLIYGAGEQGMMALQLLLNANSTQYTPVGFLDENPAMENRMVNGFSVFGGHWKLERLIRTKNIDELHIADPDIKPEVMGRVKDIAQKNGLEIQLMQTELKNLNINSTNNDYNKESLEYVN